MFDDNVRLHSEKSKYDKDQTKQLISSIRTIGESLYTLYACSIIRDREFVERSNYYSVAKEMISIHSLGLTTKPMVRVCQFRKQMPFIDFIVLRKTLSLRDPRRVSV